MESTDQANKAADAVRGRWVDRPAAADAVALAAWVIAAVIGIWRVFVYPHTLGMAFAAALDGMWAWVTWWVLLAGVRRLDRGHIDVAGLPSPEIVPTLGIGAMSLVMVCAAATLLREVLRWVT